MGIRHFSGLFVLLCVGVAGALLTLAGEHAFYRLVLPRIRRRQKFKYWLHTSQKIHRALNMTYEDVKKQQANPEKSCNLQKAQPPQPPPGPPAPGSSAKWNNEGSKEASDGARDNKRVHFNLETLNSRRLLAKASASESEGKGKGEGGGGVASLTSRLCENGGPTSFASLVLSLPSSSSTTPPPSSSSSSGGPPRPGELQELQEKIEVIRDQLRVALARRAELQTSLAKEKANPVPAVTGTPPLPLPTATPLPLTSRTRCATTMTDPPVKTVPKLRSVTSRHTSEKR